MKAHAGPDGHTVTDEVGAWLVTAWWPLGAVGGPQRITLEPVPHPRLSHIARGVSTTVLRQVNVPAMVEAREALVSDEQDEGTVAEAFRVLRALPRPTQAGGNQEYYAALLETYGAMQAAGYKAPAVTLANWLKIPPATLRNQLTSARKSMGGSTNGKH